MQNFHISLILILSIAYLSATEKPNIILINIDDLGYNDFSCYGSQTIKTPNLDRMAQQGRRFTDFMNASSICTPSRAALMTGSYPKRVGMESGVIFPEDTRGLHPNEVTLADVLKQAGYTTSCVGKWHLGHEPELLPISQGFDYYYGIPYSNDMMRRESKMKKPSRNLSDQKKQWAAHKTSHQAWDVPLYENATLLEAPVDQRTITQRYTDKVLEKIETRGDQPFFIYLAHSMPHLPVYVPQKLWKPNFKKSYKIAVEHLDAEVGRILLKLKEDNLNQNTYVFVTSDNGPSPKQFGSALPLKGKKFSNHEGGHRVPFIAWAPTHIPAGTTYEGLVTAMDLLPTFASIADVTLDPSITIDGHDLSQILDEGGKSPNQEFLYYSKKGQLTGIRQGAYKYKIDSTEQGITIKELYNLDHDLSEKNNLIHKKPALARTLEARMQVLDLELSAEARPAWIEQ